MKRNSPTVLVTDAHQRGIVATCRGLSAAGYTVAAATPTRPAPAQWSRACSERLALPDPLTDEEAYLDALASQLASGSYAALIVGSDEALRVISAHRRELEGHTRIGLPPAEVVSRALDKTRLTELAELAGLPSPETITCRDEAAAHRAAGRLGYPLVIKAERVVQSVDGGIRREPSRRANTPAELQRLLPRFGDSFLIQRYSTGPVISFGGVRADGKLLAHVASRYVRTWPPEAGNVCFSESIAAPAALTDAVGTLLESLEWEGIFEVEVLAQRDGTFAAIDLNPRPYGSMALAIKTGVNLPAIWTGRLLGSTTRPAVARAGVTYRWEDGDLRHLVWSVRRGRFRDAVSVLRPRPGSARAYFSPSDPLPLAVRIAAAFRSAV